MQIDPLKIAIKGTTQDHLPIEDVIDGIVVMKDGSCTAILKTSSVNFDLLSEKEQSALVFAYGGILNSLNFPIQIVIHSNTKDVSSYLKNLSLTEQKLDNPLLKERMQSYRKFIEETVKKNDVLSKSFYITIPFLSVELGLKEARNQIFGAMNPFGGVSKSPASLPFPKEYILEKAKASLEPKRDHLMRLFSRLGLEIRPLDTRELVELFYKIYNEQSSVNQKLQTMGYNAPVVTTK